MEFIIDNYLVIIIVGLFFVFALIGYLIDIIRKSTIVKNDEIPENIKPVEISEISISKQEESINELIKTEENNDNNDADELLKNYDESVSE